MNYVRSTVAQTRAMMAPGNPVPNDAFGDAWREPSGQAAYERIITRPRHDADDAIFVVR